MVACASFMLASGSAFANPDPIYTGNGYFLVHLNSVTWKVMPDGQATRTDYPKFSYPEGAAYGNGHWLAWNSGFTVSTDGVSWKPINLGQVSPPNANIAATEGWLSFAGGQFHMTTAMTNQICSSTTGVNWTCSPAFSSGRTSMSQLHVCGNTLYRFAEASRPTPTGVTHQTEVVTQGSGGQVQKFYIDAPYTSSACFGKDVVFYGESYHENRPFAVTDLSSKTTRIEKMKGVIAILSAAGSSETGLLVVGPEGSNIVLVMYSHGSFHPVKTSFIPQSVAYEDGTFLATSYTKMYVSKNGTSWKLVR